MEDTGLLRAVRLMMMRDATAILSQGDRRAAPVDQRSAIEASYRIVTGSGSHINQSLLNQNEQHACHMKKTLFQAYG